MEARKPGGFLGAKRSQEEPGGARRSQGSQEPLGAPRSSKALPGPSWPSLAFPGSFWLLLGARKSQEEDRLGSPRSSWVSIGPQRSL